MFFFRGKPAFEVRQSAVFEFGSLVQVVIPFGFLYLSLYAFDLFTDALQFSYSLFFCIVTGPHGIGRCSAILEFLLKRIEPFPACLVCLLSQGGFLYLHLHDLSGGGIEIRRKGVDLGTDHCRGLVNKVNCLVGEEPVGDVPV